MKSLIYDFQDAELPRLFESLPDSVATVLGIMKPWPPTAAVVELEDQGRVVSSRPYPETHVSLLMKRKDSVFAERPFWLRCSGRINFSVPRARGLVSMTLSQPNK